MQTDLRIKREDYKIKLKPVQTIVMVSSLTMKLAKVVLSPSVSECSANTLKTQHSALETLEGRMKKMLSNFTMLLYHTDLFCIIFLLLTSQGC